MSIIASELVWRKSLVVNDTTSNGGRMSATPITSGVKNNIFPDVPQSERTAGSTKYRKVFIHVANDSDLALIAPKVFVETRTPGDDIVTFFAATHRDVQSGIVGTENKYGSGLLNATVNAGVNQIVVACESTDANLKFFRASGKIRISDKSNINGAGNEEYLTISGTPSWNGNLCTITTSTNLINGYTATVTKVAAVYEPSDVSAVVANWAESGSGTYNESTYPVLCDSISTIEQDWTIVFTSATAFRLDGDTLGSNVATGNVSTNFEPSNPDYSKPYFTLRAAGFGGTWTTGNTITFRTSPASIPLWYRRDVPAGAASLSGNSVIVAVDGESA